VRAELRTGLLLVYAGLLTGVGGAGLVHAQSGTIEPFRVSYAATDGCPQQDVFANQVLARTTRARLAGPGESARTFVVNVAPGATDYSGTLTVTQPGAEASVRRVSARTCDEVVEALGLVAALTIDPTARTEPAAELASPAPAPAVPAAPSAGAPASPPTAPQTGLAATEPPLPTPIPAPPVPPSPPPAAAQPTEEPEPPEPELMLVLGAGLELKRGALPVFGDRWAPLPRLFADFGSGRSELWSPRVGLSLSGWTTRQDKLQLGEAQLTWLAARLEGCPLNLTSSASAAVRLCAFVEAGPLIGSGYNRPDSSLLHPEPTQTRGWAAAGVLVRLELQPVDGVQVRIEGGLAFTFRQYKFLFRDPPDGNDELIFEVPLIAPHLGIGVGLPFGL